LSNQGKKVFFLEQFLLCPKQKTLIRVRFLLGAETLIRVQIH